MHIDPNSLQPLLIEPVKIESQGQDKITEVFNTSIQEAVVEPSRSSPPIKKPRKKKKNRVSSLTQFGWSFITLTDTQKNQVLSQLIAKYQEIFNEIKKEHPNCPKFNVWLKDSLEKYSLMIDSSFWGSIYLNLLKEIEILKNNHKNNKEELNKITQFEYLCHQMKDYCYYEDTYEEDIVILKNNSKKRLDAALQLDFIPENLKNHLVFTCMFLEKIANHPNLKEILEINSTEGKLHIADLINHPSLNLKISFDFPQVKEQLKKNIKLFQGYSNLLHSILAKMRQNFIIISVTQNLEDDEGKDIKADEQYSIYSVSLGIKNKFEEIDSILSKYENLDEISLEEYFEIFNIFSSLSLKFKDYRDFIKLDGLERFSEIFESNHELMRMIKIAQNLGMEENPLTILSLLSHKTHMFIQSVINSYSYGFGSLLMKNNKLNKNYLYSYYFEIFTLLKKIKEFFSSQPSFIMKNGNKMIENFYSEHAIYLKNLRSRIAKETKTAYDILPDISHLLTSYGKLEKVIKEVIYDQIKRKLAMLEREKDVNKIELLKIDLNSLYKIYDDCFKIIKTFNKAFVLNNNPVPQEIRIKKIEEKKELPTKIEVNEVLPEVSLEMPQEEITIPKDETSIKIEDKPLDINHNIQDPLPNPSNVSRKTTPKQNILSKKKEEKRGSNEIINEIGSLDDEISYASHKKRRHLLQTLHSKGWKFDESSGKGSHLKAEGPNGTSVFVPKNDVIKHGTFNSIMTSVRQDELKNESPTTKKNEPKVSNVNKKNNQRRKQK